MMREVTKMFHTKYGGRCRCSAMVYPGDRVKYSIAQRKIVGCPFCNFTGQNPDPESDRIAEFSIDPGQP